MITEGEVEKQVLEVSEAMRSVEEPSPLAAVPQAPLTTANGDVRKRNSTDEPDEEDEDLFGADEDETNEHADKKRREVKESETMALVTAPAKAAHTEVSGASSSVPASPSVPEGAPPSTSIANIPRKSSASSPGAALGSPSHKPVPSSSSTPPANASPNNTGLLSPATFGLPAGVHIPKTVTTALLQQGKLLETLKGLPVNLINDALTEYDDAVDIKGGAIRNHGAYLYGVVKRYVSVHDRANSEGRAILPMGADLTPIVNARLEELVHSNFCTREEMNDKVKSKIRMLSEKDALFALDELSSVDRGSIRNFGSYFMGILNRYMRGDTSSKQPQNRPPLGGGGPDPGRPRPDQQQPRGRDRLFRENVSNNNMPGGMHRDRSRDRYDDHNRFPPPQLPQAPMYDIRLQQQQQQAPPPLAWQQNHHQGGPPPPPPMGYNAGGGGNNPNMRTMNPPGPGGGGMIGGMSNYPPPQQPQSYMPQQQQQQFQPQQPQYNPQNPYMPQGFSGDMSQQSIGGYQQQHQQHQQQPLVPGQSQHQPYMGNHFVPQQQQQQQQPPPMMMTQQSVGGGGGNMPGGPSYAQQQSWQQHPQGPQPPIPVDILGLADKAASAVQAINQSKQMAAIPQHQPPGFGPQHQQHQAPSYPPGANFNLGQPSTQQHQPQPMPYAPAMGVMPLPISQHQPPLPPHQQHQHQPPMPYRNNAPPPPGGGGGPAADASRRSVRHTTAKINQLPVTVQYAVHNLQATGAVEQLDEGILGMIFDLPEEMALTALQKFASIDKTTMRNRTAYLAGVLRGELKRINKR